MRTKYYIVSCLICIFTAASIYIFTPEIFAQQGIPELPPEELIRKMLSEEELPPEVQKELEALLEEGKAIAAGKRPPAIKPRGARFPPVPVDEDERLLEEAPVFEEGPRLEIGRYSEETVGEVIEPVDPNRISLDLKGVDIIDVLKMLSSRSGLNIVAGRNVRGRVTLFLKDVDVWDAFEIILAANNLAYEKRADIINVMTERDYEQLYGEKYYNKKDLRVFRLEYAKAVDVSKALNQAKSKIGKIITDEPSNTLIVIDSPKSIAEMGG